MSSILKALRKIEEEKRVASHAAPDLRMDQGLAQAKSRPLLPLIAGVALGSVCVGLFVLWSPSETPRVVEQPVPAPQSFAAENKPTVPVEVVSPEVRAEISLGGTKPTQEHQVQDSSPVNDVESAEIPEVVISAEPIKGLSSKAEDSISVETPVSLQEKSVPPEAIKRPNLANESTPEHLPAKPLPVQPTALPEGLSLQVSEIFYQADVANSMAVVNDLPVMVGTYVESAVVIDILPERVLFKIGDDTYDVPVTPLQ